MNEFYDEVPLIYPMNEPRSSEDEHFGNGWSVRKSGEKFIFEYISGELAGRAKEVEISVADFFEAKSGRLGFDELCRKYRVS